MSDVVDDYDVILQGELISIAYGGVDLLIPLGTLIKVCGLAQGMTVERKVAEALASIEEGETE